MACRQARFAHLSVASEVRRSESLFSQGDDDEAVADDDVALDVENIYEENVPEVAAGPGRVHDLIGCIHII